MNKSRKNMFLFGTWMQKEQNLSKSTYTQYLSIMYRYMRGKAADHIPDKASVMEYLGSIGDYCDEVYYNFNIAGIVKYAEYLLAEEFEVDKELFYLPRKKTWEKIPFLLTRDEVKRIMDECDLDTFLGQRDFALINLLYHLGLRITEAISIELQDIENETLHLRFCKGKKHRRMPLPMELKEILQPCIDQRKNSECSAVFQNSWGKPLLYQTAYNQIKQYVAMAGIEKKISPHSFRHAFATNLMENGTDVRIVQQLLGHASIDSTNLYLHMNTKDLQSAFRKAHPRYNHSIQTNSPVLI